MSLLVPLFSFTFTHLSSLASLPVQLRLRLSLTSAQLLNTYLCVQCNEVLHLPLPLSLLPSVATFYYNFLPDDLVCCHCYCLNSCTHHLFLSDRAAEFSECLCVWSIRSTLCPNWLQMWLQTKQHSQPHTEDRFTNRETAGE